MKYIRALFLLAAMVFSPLERLNASGHGPVFALATPTSPRGGWSFDTSFMGRLGAGSGGMFRGTLGYGITENLKVSVSAPIVFRSERFIPSRTAAFTPMGGDIEGLALWRFHRRDFGVGARFETTAIGGLLVPGPQEKGGAGGMAGLVTGVASRSHYV